MRLLALLFMVAAAGCRGPNDVDRTLTREAEERAAETRITSAPINGDGDGLEPEFASDRASYRRRVEAALDAADRRRRDLARDLEALDRATEQDWATLRPRIENDLR